MSKEMDPLTNYDSRLLFVCFSSWCSRKSTIGVSKNNLIKIFTNQFNRLSQKLKTFFYFLKYPTVRRIHLFTSKLLIDVYKMNIYWATDYYIYG